TRSEPNRCAPSLRAFAISLGGNGDRADDLEQETNAPPINLAVCRCSWIARAIAKISATRPRSRLHWRPFLSYPRSISSHCLAKYDMLTAKQDIQVAETTISMVDSL